MMSRHAEGEQGLGQLRARHTPEEDALHEDPHRGHHRRARQRGEQQAAGAPRDRQRDIGAQEVVRAVGEVQDAHEAEDERETGGEEEEQHAEGDAVEDLDEVEAHQVAAEPAAGAAGPRITSTSMPPGSA